METFWESLVIACSRSWFGAYLHMLAITYTVGGLVHLAALLGRGSVPFSEIPPLRKAGEALLALLDLAAATALWFKSPWGLFLFPLAAAMQLVLYSRFPQLFAPGAEPGRAVRTLAVFHVVTLILLVGLYLLGR